jgi:hypothetical protein
MAVCLLWCTQRIFNSRLLEEAAIWLATYCDVEKEFLEDTVVCPGKGKAVAKWAQILMPPSDHARFAGTNTLSLTRVMRRNDLVVVVLFNWVNLY